MVRPSSRRLLLDAFARALAAADPRPAVRRALTAAPPCAPWLLLAVGKAARAMANGALDAAPTAPVAALVVAPDVRDGAAPMPALREMKGGHPLPDAGSLAAGAAILELLDGAPADAELVVLLSGGASALVEQPPDGISLADLERLNRWLLASGLPIGAVNRVRAQYSQLKGGRLAARWGARPARVLLVSDVPGDRVADIGSGPFAMPTFAPSPALPAELAMLTAAPPPGPVPEIDHTVVTSNADARTAVLAFGSERGLAAYDHGASLGGDATEQGRALAKALAAAPPGLHVWGGETTVRLPPNAGRGGRCQQLALAVAAAIERREDVVLLAAGTDGRDGPGQAAGALVDGGTLARGVLEGRDAAADLARADAGGFLAAAGELVDTGPTGTNVADLVIAVKT